MSLSNKLEIWRKDLIDMSRRNPLLYYKSDGPRAAGIQLLPYSPALLFSQLHRESKTVALDKVPSALELEDLQHRLLRLRARVREDENDRGIRTLYLVFGMLEWYESPYSQEMIRSPLVFMPVILTYKTATDTFTLTFVDDPECEINPTLREKLNHDFKIVLPTFDEIAGSDNAASLSLDDLLSSVKKVLPDDDRWKVLPEVHLGRFAFQKLVMYQDLQRNSANILVHPLLRVLGGEALRPTLPSWLPPTHEFDDRIAPKQILEILDADSSQQEAILLAKAGVSFVLKGPPGTGKSQTIANIIAETLGQGKKVLFVSEKMAALDVVRKRLRDAGLGDFCLDLHNPRTNSAQKAEFVNALKISLDDARRMPESTSEASWERLASELQLRRTELNTYVRELHLERKPLGKSAFNAFGELARLADVPDLDFSIPSVGAVTQNQLDAMIRMIQRLDACHDVLAAYDSHPWRETRASSYSLALESDIRAHYTRLSTHLRTLHDSLEKVLRLLGEIAAVNFSSMPHVVQRAQVVRESPLPLRSWLSREALARLRPQAERMVELSKVYAEQVHRFEPVYSRSFLSENLETLRQALSENGTQTITCLRDQVGSPCDTAITLRPELEKHLSVASQTLMSISPASETVAELCAVEPPETLGEANGLISLAKHLLLTPTPPSEWLNPSKFAVVRAMAAEAQERYTQSIQMRQELERLYQPSFFALDLHSLAERFRTKYRSVIRFFDLSFHRDVKLVRSLLLPGTVRTVAQIEADIYMAVKVLDMEAALADKRIEYAQTLDRYFDGAQTDWDKISGVLRWVTELNQIMAGTPVSSAMAALIIGPTKALRPISAALDRLADLFASWENEEAFCISHLHVSSLLQGINSFDDVAPAKARGSLDRLLSELRQFWQAVDTVQRFRHVAPDSHQAVSWARLCADVNLAQDIQEFEARLAEESDAYASDFGHYFTGTTTNWQTINDVITWTEGFLRLHDDRAIPELTLSLVAFPGDPTRLGELQQALDSLQKTMPQANVELTFSDSVLARTAFNVPGKTFETSALATLADRVDFHIQQLPALKDWLVCQQRLNDCRQGGLDNFVGSLLRQRPIPQHLVATFQRRFNKLWLDGVRTQSPALARFRGDEHSSAISVFRDLDNGHKTRARVRLNAVLKQRRRHIFSGSGADTRSDLDRAVVALTKETQKKRRRGIRVIVQKTATALIELKPCWMMSPLSVSQFLDSGEQLFDLVIFDEASQVCPEDSVSSIMRGKQLIVVGDPMQLPPTRFFAKSLADDVGDEDEEDESDDKEERTQSILNECLGSAFHERSLQWHYRSADEALIAFSNHHFYGDQLVTFPSANGDKAQGVSFEYVENSNYKRGRNSNEAARVADIVFDYLQVHEDRSLGIVALGAAQQDTIIEALQNRMKRKPSLKRFADDLSGDDPNGIFIKNLESVQGDERDTIILSVGYGPEGGTIHKRFGPVNNTGGERRLNVAVTRARKRMIVVSSMRAEDLPTHMASKGARTLRHYLEYAEKCSEGGAKKGAEALAGQVESGTGSSADSYAPQFDSPFEEAVYDALAARGLQLDTQVGCSGYRLDMAVVDPEHLGSYLLGIECDGASYHSSKTARDRDRLRQAQLEDMGWKLHRIWSSDWFAAPDREVLKVLDTLSEVIQERIAAASATQLATTSSGQGRTSPIEAHDDGESDSVDSSTLPLTTLTLLPLEHDLSTPESPNPVITVVHVETNEQHDNDSAPSDLSFSSSREHLSEVATSQARRDVVESHRQTGSGVTLPRSTFACEDCHHFLRVSPTEFRCGWNGELKKADKDGHTPACTVWRPAQ